MRIDITDDELEEIRKKKIEELMQKMNSTTKIKLYRTQTCPYCHMAAEYLRSKGVEFEEIDVGRDQQAAFEMIRKSGQMGVPVIDINGEIIVGFDKFAIDLALKKIKK